MKIILFFERGLIKSGTKLYSSLCGEVKFKEIRPLNPSDNRSPNVIVCEDVLGKPIFFNHEGKAIVWHPSGEMIYSTNMGECMLFLGKGISWEKIFEKG